VLNAAPQLLRSANMPRLGRADEVVVRDVQTTKKILVLRGDAVGEYMRREPGLLGSALHLLAVLVGSGQEEHIVTRKPARAGDRVGDHRRVRVAQVRFRVDVVDRGRDVKTRHHLNLQSSIFNLQSRRSSQAFVATAWTSFTGS